MKYIEFVYLGAAIVLAVLLVQGFQQFELASKLMLVVSIGITSFMFSFRRKQRIKFEKAEKERIRKMEEEAAE